MAQSVRCAALLALLILSCVPPSSLGASGSGSGLTIAPVSDEYAAESYANDYGVDIARAREVLKEQAKGAGLMEELRRELGSDYGQVWFKNGRYVVYAVGTNVLSRARAAIEQRGIVEEPTLHDVPWNAADLTAGLKQLSKGLGTEIESRHVSVSVAQGGLRVVLSPDTNDAAAVSAAADAVTSKRQVPIGVTHSAHALPSADPAYALPGLRNAGEPLIAGLYYRTPVNPSTGIYYICTLGFVSHAVGGTFYLTADHCLNSFSGGQKQVCGVNWRCTTFGADVGGYMTGDLDAGVIGDSGVIGSYPAMLDWLNPWITDGVYGANLCIFGGDSGGPLRSPNNGYATGILSGSSDVLQRREGGCGTYMHMFYTDAAHAASVLGVTISTL